MEKKSKSCAYCKLFRIFAAAKQNKEMEIYVRYLPEARNFLKEIDQDVKEKVIYNVKKVRMGVKDSNIFKKLDDTNIWEFRTKYNGNYYRLLSFWDKRTETIIVATHGFVKKSAKTPKKEIAKAEAIRKDYFENN